MDEIYNSSFYGGINALLESMLNDFLKDTSNFLLAARIIAGIGMLISSYFTFFQMMDEKPESMSKFLGRFMMIYLALFYYSTFITIINVPLKAISESVKVVAFKDVTKIDDLYKNATSVNKPRSINDPEKDAELAKYLDPSKGSSGNDTVDNIINMTNDTGGFMVEAIISGISDLLVTISQLCILIINVIRTFFLIVLSTFGIFVIALSSFPNLEGSFMQWLQKYINVYLWLPIGYILQSIMLKLEVTYKEAGEVGNVSIDTSLITLLISLCTIVGFLAIPTLSSWMINASTQGMASKVKSGLNNAQATMSKVGSSTGSSISSLASGKSIKP